jgi:hypothetical protein
MAAFPHLWSLHAWIIEKPVSAINKKLVQAESPELLTPIELIEAV